MTCKCILTELNFFITEMLLLGNKMNVLYKNRGFTLTEIIIVIALAGIIMTIAIPSFLNWLPNIRFRQASRDFFLDLQMAKIEAVKRNVNVGVAFNLAGGGCPALGNPVPSPGGGYVVFLDDGNGGGIADDAIQNGGEQALQTRNFPTNVAFCANSLAANLAFQPNGLPTGTTNLTVQNDTGRQRIITVSLAGNVDLN